MTRSESQTPQRNNSASLRKALTILMHLGEDHAADGLTAAQLSRELEINKSTVLRLLQPLLDSHFVEFSDFGAYRLSWQNARLGQGYLAGIRVDLDMHSVLVNLTSTTRETSHLVRAAAPDVVYIDKVDSPLSVRMFSRVGNTSPMYSSSVGKCILAFANEDVITSVMAEGMPARTPATITTEDGMREELAIIRQQGWAIDDIENEDGIRCVAAPIFDSEGSAQYALSISGPVSRVTTERVPELVPVVQTAATDVSQRLGARMPLSKGKRT